MLDLVIILSTFEVTLVPSVWRPGCFRSRLNTLIQLPLTNTRQHTVTEQQNCQNTAVMISLQFPAHWESRSIGIDGRASEKNIVGRSVGVENNDVVPQN